MLNTSDSMRNRNQEMESRYYYSYWSYRICNQGTPNRYEMNNIFFNLSQQGQDADLAIIGNN